MTDRSAVQLLSDWSLILIGKIRQRSQRVILEQIHWPQIILNSFIILASSPFLMFQTYENLRITMKCQDNYCPTWYSDTIYWLIKWNNDLLKQTKSVTYVTRKGQNRHHSNLNKSMRESKIDPTSRFAIVTGGRVKIGAEVALRLLRDGCTVIVTDQPNPG